jgi:hypothetical protein
VGTKRIINNIYNKIKKSIMSRQNLNEQINRIKQLLNIKESSVIEEAGNPIMAVIKKLIPDLEEKITTALEKELGKALSASTDKEIEVALKSATMAATRKEIAAAIYAVEKNMIDDVFKKYNMSIPTDASKAYVELQDNGLNRGILKDIVGEWKAGGKGASSSATPPTPPPPAPKPKPADPTNTFKVPDFELEIPNFWKMDEKATRAALKNMFPKAGSSDIEKMVVSLRNMKITDQAAFEKAFKNAVSGFGPRYQEILTKTSNLSKITSRYAALPTWGKIIFWLCTTPIGYNLLKGLGVPVDKTLGKVIEGWKGMFADQVNSVTGNDSNNSSNSGNQTTTYSFDDSGVLQYLSKTYPVTPTSDYELRKLTTPYNGYAVKLKGGSVELTFKHENGNYTKVN